MTRFKNRSFRNEVLKRGLFSTRTSAHIGAVKYTEDLRLKLTKRQSRFKPCLFDGHMIDNLLFSRLIFALQCQEPFLQHLIPRLQLLNHLRQYGYNVHRT